MNLMQLIENLPETTLQHSAIPDYLFGAFRRKSISFFNGLTDEKTIVYWFQSKSFTIDLRLKDRTNTPIVEKQAWIGDTLWDQEQQLLSWQVNDFANYQNHIQWPEPAQLHAVGNCILEFSPSNVYVEDWRQQATSGLFLGLRLCHAIHVQSDTTLKMDGGLIICGKYIAYAQSRLPSIQQKIAEYETLTHAVSGGISEQAIQSFEVSVSDNGQTKIWSTQNSQLEQSAHFKTFNFEGFEQIDAETLQQRIEIDGEAYLLIFMIDVYVPHHSFQRQTSTTEQSLQWMEQERQHLLHHAKITL